MGRDVCEHDPMASCYHDCDPCGPLPADRGLVYIAGPYTHPDPVENTRKAIDAWQVLMDAGFTPIVPHLSLFTHLVYPHPPEYWYEYDLRLLDRCDIMLRLPGESWGADREEEHARELGITVHHMTAEEFVERYGTSGDFFRATP